MPQLTCLLVSLLTRRLHLSLRLLHSWLFLTQLLSFPGATVPVISEKLPGLLRSLPTSITKVIMHVGFNNTSRQQSEETKRDFNKVFKLLRGCGKSVFISGPLPSLARGGMRFSRLLYLNTWLQSTCSLNSLAFIDNFNLFWNRSSFYRADGIHPRRLGN